MRPFTFAITFFLLCAIGLAACATLITPGLTAPAAPAAQLSAAPALASATTTPAAWEIKAAGDAAATQAAAAYTAVAERTRVEGERQATATAQRLATQESDQITRAAPTLAALQLSIDAARNNATREAKMTETADALSALKLANSLTQEAGATATNAAMLATESARRAQNQTSAQLANSMAGAGVEAAKAIALLVGAGVLVYVVRKFLPVALLWFEARARLIPSGPAPMQAITGPDQRLQIVFISNRLPTAAPEPQFIEQPPLGQDAPAAPPSAASVVRYPGVPLVLAANDDNPARPLLWRVLNLLASATDVAGNEARAIPRYDKIGFDSNVRQELTHALEAAGLVTISNAGTQLTNGETLYSLYYKLSSGQLKLDPITATLEAATAA